ncbi:hypothetical protein Tco_0556585 [Tanacetum coccineum]
MNYIPVSVENQVNVDAGTQDSYVAVEDVAPAAHEKPSESSSKVNDVQDSEDVADKVGHSVSTANLTPYVSAASTPTGANVGESSFVYLGGKIPIDASTLSNNDLPIDSNMPDLEDDSDAFTNDGIFNGAYDDENVGAMADFNNMDATINERFKKDSSAQQDIGELTTNSTPPLPSTPRNTESIGKPANTSPAAPTPISQAFTRSPAWKQAMHADYSADPHYRRIGTIVLQLCPQWKLGTLATTCDLSRNKKGQESNMICDQHKVIFGPSKKATTPLESNTPLAKDEDGVRFQVTPKASHLNAVKRIFRYLKHQPKLGLWYPRDSPFELEAFSDNIIDYGGASLARKSTTVAVKFLVKIDTRQCKKQTIMANSTTEAEYETNSRLDLHMVLSSIPLFSPVVQVVSTTFVEQFWMTTKSKTINNVRYITATVAGKPVSISKASIRSDLQFNDAARIDVLPNQAIFNTIQLMGFKLSKPNFFDGMMRHLDAKKKFVMYPPFIPVFLTNQLKNVPVLLDHFPNNALTTKDERAVFQKDQLNPTHTFSYTTQVKTQSEPQLTHSSDLLLSNNPLPDSFQRFWWNHGVSLQKKRLARKKSLKTKLMQKESVFKQGRKPAKSKPTVHKDPTFDDLDDAIDYMEPEDAHDEGTVKDSEETRVRTDMPKVSTDKLKVSTDKPNEGTAESNEGIVKPKDGNSDESAAPTTVFRDDETIAQFLVTMSQNKTKQKGFEIKEIKDTDRPRTTTKRSILTLKPLPKIDPKDKGKKVLEEKAESEGVTTGNFWNFK